jgi:hypothetical protein
MFIIPFWLVLAAVCAMTSFLQYEARWWKGSFYALCLIVIGLVVSVSGFSGGLSPELWTMAGILSVFLGIVALIAALLTLAVRGSYSRKQVVTWAFGASVTIWICYYLTLLF